MLDGECSLEHLLAGRDVAPVPSRRIASLVSLRKPIGPEPSYVASHSPRFWPARDRSAGADTAVCLEFSEPITSRPVRLGGILRSRSGYRHGFEFVDLSQDEREVIGKTCRTLALLQ